MGRQPWIVFGLMPTAEGVSPGVSAATVLTSLIVFTLIYGALAVVEVGSPAASDQAGTAGDRWSIPSPTMAIPTANSP